MPSPERQNAGGPDAASLVVSVLWQTHGHTALRAELVMRLGQEHGQPEVAVLAACRQLSQAGWVDLLHEELPAARLTPEAVQALLAHAHGGAPLPERLERAHERAARLAQESTAAQTEQASLLRQALEESRAMRAENAELRRMYLEDRAARQALPGGRAPARLPGPPLPSPRTYVQCPTCGGGQDPKCRTCGGTGEVPL